MRILVLGAAVSGRAAVGLAGRLGDEVVVYDRDEAAAAAVEGQAVIGRHGEWDPAWLAGADVVVASPGFSEHSTPLRDAARAGVPIWSELEYAARHARCPIAAVTGTNGKTTTTSLITDMLLAAGRRAVAVGNIGAAFSDAADGDAEVLVVEASSFQLRYTDRFHPQVAVILNVAPDHLDWHGSYEAYRDAKARITFRQTETDTVVFDVDDAEATRLAARGAAALVPVSGRRRMPAAGADGFSFWVGESGFSLDDIVRADPAWKDPALLVDAAAAAAAAASFGVDADHVATALRSYHRPPHRRTVVGEWDGIVWVNDSKATNPHAAAAAAAAYPSVILIAGGRNKGLDLSPLARTTTIRRIVALGEAASELMAIRPEATEVTSGMEAAVAAADRHARPGDTVLLAPGCASFDQFADYQERGDAFATAVLYRKEKA